VTLLETTFNTVKCKDCGHEALEGILKSFNSHLDLPLSHSFGGVCPKCSSKNTCLIKIFDDS
jgi:Zn ribbon nucleic-acid-binding protein